MTVYRSTYEDPWNSSPFNSVLIRLYLHEIQTSGNSATIKRSDNSGLKTGSYASQLYTCVCAVMDDNFLEILAFPKDNEKKHEIFWKILSYSLHKLMIAEFSYLLM
jgi:hypothetical protein